MKMEIFTRIFNAVCNSFPMDCNGCFIKGAWEKKGCTSCDDFLSNHQRDAELALATWIGVTDYVKTMGTQEPQKEPETRREILQAAERCVCGDRDSQYGSPENSFRAIASMWNSYLYAKGLIENNRTGWKGIVPQDVAAMMVLFKMARVATGQNKADNWIDGAGYAACGGEIAANKKT